MTYATRSDIEGIYGARHLATLVPVDVDLDVAVGNALAEAKAEIDVYLRARYSLPLAVVPQLLRTCAIDIACYRLAVTAAALSDEVAGRAKRAIEILKDVGAGRAKLDELEPPPAAGGGAGDGSADGAAFAVRPRLWGDAGGAL